jgi:hypothetical protein
MGWRAGSVVRVGKLLAIAVMIASPAAAQAQSGSAAAGTPAMVPGTPAFAQLVEGKTVRVTTADGHQQRGKAGSLSQTGMVVGATPVSFAQITRVDKVSHRVRNYGLLGLAAGVSAGLAFQFNSECDGDAECGPVVSAFGAIGAGTGFALGAILNHTGRDVIYIAGKRTATLAAAPIVTPTRKGLALSVTWR